MANIVIIRDVGVQGPQGIRGADPELTALEQFTGSIQTQVNSLRAATSSYVQNSQTASMLQPYVLNSSTSSMLQPYVLNSSTSSMSVLSSSYAATASCYQETDPIFTNKSGSFATTASNIFHGSQTINGDVFITGSITAQQYIVSSSVIYVTESNFSGSHIFGNTMDDTHQFTGSIYMTGSMYISPAGIGSIYFSESSAASQLTWNDVDGTLELGLKGGVVKSELGQGLVTRIVNKTVPNIDLLAANYQVVVVGGAAGQRLAVKLAQADNDANSAGTLGLVAENIAKNQEGFIITVGLLKNCNTTGALQGENWNDGDILYLSPTTAGAITNIKPQAPQHAVIIGYVEYAHQNNGKIYVKIDNGYELDELHNVRITTASLTAGQLLVRSGSNNGGVWINSTQLTGSYGLTGSLNVQGSILASSFTGSLQGTGSWASNTLTASRLEGMFSLTANSSAANRTISGLGGLAFNNNASIDQDAQRSLIFRTTPDGNVGSLATRLTISGSGQVGINITPFSLASLTVSGGVILNGSSSYFQDYATWPVQLHSGQVNNGIGIYSDIVGQYGYSTSSPYYQFGQGGSATWRLATSTNQGFLIQNVQPSLNTRFYVSASGFVGIGTSTPDSNLHVFKGSSGTSGLGLLAGTTLTLENSTTNYINFKTPNAVVAGLAFSTPADSSAGYISLRQSTGEMFYSTENANGYHTFLTADTERLQISNTATSIRNNLIVTGSTQGNVAAVSISSNTASINLSAASFFTLTLPDSINTHISASNIMSGITATVLITTGNASTVSFHSSVKQPSGSAYTPTTSAAKDILTLISYDASSLYVANVKNLI